MAEYTIDKIRNVIFVSHSGAGKTSLIEAMLYKAGAIPQMGSIEAGNTVGDYNPDEIERKTTMSAKIMNLSWNGIRFNIVDTPGYADFVGGVISAIAGVDAGVLLVDAGGGIEIGTERSWTLLEEAALPRLIFVNKMDKPDINQDKLMEALINRFGKKCTALSGEFSEQVIEKIAESDDALLEKFLEGGQLSEDELNSGMSKAILNGSIVPVLFGSVNQDKGIKELLDFISKFFPSPKDRGSVKAKAPDKSEPIDLPPDADAPFSACVFNTVIDPYVGQLSMMRIFSGRLSPDSVVFNSTKQGKERIGQLLDIQGKNTSPRTQAQAGDIIAVAKLKNTHTGDTLCEEKNQVIFEPIKFPEAAISISIKPKSRGDEDKILGSLGKLSMEDPSFKVLRDVQTKELVISGLGDLHLEVMINRLKNRFNVEVERGTPKVAYKETITAKSDSQYRHKKQTGGAGQFAEVWMRIEPLPRGAGFEFISEVVGGAIPAPFIVSCEKGIRSIMETGILAGYPITDVKAIVYDGKTHPVDSKDIAFQIAARNGFKEAFLKARPVLLEPIMEVEIMAPEEYMGSITGTISSKRGRIMGIDVKTVKAKIPLAEMYKYASELKSITSGRASYTMKFSHYEEVPSKIAQTIIEQAKAQKAEGKEE